MPGEAPAVRVRGLVKSYGSMQAVRGIDLDIRYGEIFALLGLNGAGKTTTVEILEGYRDRDSGEVSVLGYDPGRTRAKIKPRVGIVLQQTGVDQYLTVAETVAMYASYYPRPRSAEEVTSLVGLGGKRGRRVNTLSGGQVRRLDMAVALVGDPDLLFLDEPTTGFDPSARREAWEIVKSLAALGKTVLLTTHYMDEAQYLADRVAVIADGRIVAEGPPATLGNRDNAVARIRYRVPGGTAPPDGLAVTRSADGITEIASADVVADLYRLTGWALDNQVKLDDLEVTRPTLEDVYLSLTDGDAAAAVVNAVILPLEFLSGIFITFGNATPSWILWVARIFPVRHFAVAMQAGLLGTAFSWTDTLVVAAWGVAGLLLAIRFFSWEPRRG